MSWSNAEVVQPYKSLLYSYPEEDARLDQDAYRRAREFGAQGAASRGGGANPRGAATNTYNRVASDYTLGKAQTDRQNRVAYTNSQNAVMRSPGAVSPSGASTLASVGGTIGGAMLKQAAPDIYKKMKDSWWNSTPQELSQQYQNLGGSFGPNMSGELAASGAGYGMLGDQGAYGSLTNGFDPSGYADYPGGGYDYSWANSSPDFSGAYNAADWGSYGADWASRAPDFSDAYSSIAGLW